MTRQLSDRDFFDEIQEFHQMSNWSDADSAKSHLLGWPKVYPRFKFTPSQTKPYRHKRDLSDLLNQRKSIRDYSSELMTDKQVHSLARVFHKELASSPNARVIPSAGNLFSTEVYFLIRTKTDYKLVHLGPPERPIESLWKSSGKSVTDCFPNEEWVSRSPLIAIVTGKMGPALTKYGPRGYRFILLEAGAVGMVLTLAATELGIGSCMVGGYVDDQIADLLDISFAEAELPLLAVTIGNLKTSFTTDV